MGRRSSPLMTSQMTLFIYMMSRIFHDVKEEQWCHSDVISGRVELHPGHPEVEVLKKKMVKIYLNKLSVKLDEKTTREHLNNNTYSKNFVSFFLVSISKYK